jgi:hypothetical protein
MRACRFLFCHREARSGKAIHDGVEGSAGLDCVAFGAQGRLGMGAGEFLAFVTPDLIRGPS